MNTRILHVIALGSCLLAGCARSTDLPGTTGGPVDGRVIDQDSGQGVPNAFVLIRWQGGLGATSLGGSSHTVCVHAELAQTDANGSYHVPAWKNLPEERPRYVGAGNFRLFKDLGYTAYAPGYQLGRFFHENEPVVKLTKFKVTGTLNDPVLDSKEFSVAFKERLIQDNFIQQRVLEECTHSGREDEALKPLWEAMYREESSLASTAQERRVAVARHFLPDVRADYREFNYDEVSRRRDQRISAALGETREEQK